MEAKHLITNEDDLMMSLDEEVLNKSGQSTRATPSVNKVRCSRFNAVEFVHVHQTNPFLLLSNSLMRSIARQSARLASNSRTRQPSCPRHLPLPQRQQLRTFNCCAPNRGDGRNSNSPSNHTPPAEQRQEEERKTGSAEGVKPESSSSSKPDLLKDNASVDDAQKSSKKATAFRQRRNAALVPEIPKPPPIPDWFLNHNIKLQVEPMRPNREAKNAQVLRCVDKGTGHTLFVLPYYEAWPVPGFPGRSDDQPKSENNATARNTPLDNSFFDNKFTATSPKQVKSHPTTILTPPSLEAYKEISPHTLLRWPLLEAESSIRAGFELAAHGPQSLYSAASRVDLSLDCPDSDSHDQMDELVEDLAAITESDIIRLDANDIEDLCVDFVDNGSDSPGTFSNLAYEVFDGYQSTSTQPSRMIDEDEDDEIDPEEEEEEDDEARGPSNFNPGMSGRFQGLSKALSQLSVNRQDLGKALGRINVTAFPVAMSISEIPGSVGSSIRSRLRSSDSLEAYNGDELKLRALLDSLLDAPIAKKAASSKLQGDGFRHRFVIGSNERRSKDGEEPSDTSHQAIWRVWRSSPGCWFPDIAGTLAGHVNHIAGESAPVELKAFEEQYTQARTSSQTSTVRTIVHVRDLKDVCNSSVGDAVVRELLRVVQKRRKAGQQIIIVGTTARDIGSGLFASFRKSNDDVNFRKITIPPFFNMPKEEQSDYKPESLVVDTSAVPTYRRIQEINLRHISSMLSRLRPGKSLDLFTESSINHLKLAGNQALSQKVLPFDQIQRLVLTAIGLAQVHVQADSVNAGHIGLATHIAAMSDQASRAWSDRRMRGEVSGQKGSRSKDGEESMTDSDKSQARMEKLKKACNQHEGRLLAGVVDPQNIKTGFKEVHAPSETIDALKILTSLSLVRPEAFKYGVLAADRLTGIMLYGPPGTGKTLLAKAVAKESRATVLEISGAQIYEKYVGEGEKMVRAVFSLAKKLSPCIVFLDEADAIFGSRNSAGNRNTHREIINQFLREWDGMDLHNVFLMVASNRPYDLDDAVLRRLPRRILVDLPVAKDRESILGIHLKDEILDASVNLSEIAKQTPLYSGSDLKNLCVTAALACVREENELAESKADDKEFKLPEKRTLFARHFDKATKEISASISEDMASLTAIRKFDEQYGDRRGRRKKAPYGFGMGSVEVDESAARVRSSDPPPPSLPPS